MYIASFKLCSKSQDNTRTTAYSTRFPKAKWGLRNMRGRERLGTRQHVLMVFQTVWYKCCEGYWYTQFDPRKMSFILSGFIHDKELCLNKVVKALREDIFMYKQMIPAPYVEGTRAKSVNFTDGVGLSSSRWQNSAKNLVNLTLALWCGKTTTPLMPSQYTSPVLPVPKWNLYSLDNEV